MRLIARRVTFLLMFTAIAIELAVSYFGFNTGFARVFIYLGLMFALWMSRDADETMELVRELNPARFEKLGGKAGWWVVRHLDIAVMFLFYLEFAVAGFRITRSL
jgi:hypothetical protein